MSIQSTLTAQYVYDYVVSADQWLCDTLISIGILPNLIGYHHIRRAVKIVAESKRRQEIGHIYETLSYEADITAASIERNIRSAIHCAYKAERLIELNRILKVDAVKSPYQLLSNTQFIFLLAHYYTQKANQLNHIKQ